MFNLLDQPKFLLGFDAIGAVVSTVSLGIVLTYFQAYIGMPLNILFVLSFFAFCFFCHSFYHFYFYKEGSAKKLTRVAVINISYCLLTLTLVLYYGSELSLIGKTYFVVEIILVVFLSIHELKVSRNS